MSIVLLGGGILDKRGSVGGDTYSRSKFGATVRAKTSPINPKTNFQGQARCRLQGVSNMWSQVLTEIERMQWNAFALLNPQTNVFGQTSYLSGQQWFSKLSVNILQVGGTIVTTPPISGSYPALTSLALSATNGPDSILLSFTYGAYTGTPMLYTFATPILPAGTFYANNKFRFVDSRALPGAFADVVTQWKARFVNVAPLIGTKVFVLAKVIDQDTGIDSPGIIASDIVT